MKLWRIELDHEEAWWLFKLMKLANIAIDKDRPLKLDHGDLTNVKDIIRQIGHVDIPPRRLTSRVRIIDITDETDDHDDDKG